MIHYNNQHYYSIPNSTGLLFQITLSIIFCGFIGFAIYAYIAAILVLAIVLSIVIIVLYFKIISHIIKSKTIWFNEDHILLDKKHTIEYTKVVGINDDNILIEEHGYERRVFFTFFESSDLRDKMIDFWEKKNPEVAFKYTKR
ncbi:hypothetical protein [Neptunitalea lumnitzerae]|uniref:Photosystem I assembly protein Ycf4 n=1 Tax=Neptunitalea lumnitzerae TaxID=2965509 RepID=A0ABQ5MMV4_9FLAO|nr:hypothetical protein [Neptunitalea sp. Y10]GLB50435.1 hypothetical protein Y10_28030 [Neptunitalea sp. Y10]